MDELALGIDIGGSKMAFVIADRRGSIHESFALRTQPEGGFVRVVERLAQAIQPALRRHPRLCGIGIGLPGPVDAQRGIALQAANLGWQRVAFRAALQAALPTDLPILLENDVNIGALAEHQFGAGRGAQNLVYLALGTGLGGAAILNNHLLRGASHAEMEIGHISLDPVAGLPCGCGRRGCLETVLSGNGLVAQTEQAAPGFPESPLHGAPLSARAIVRAADAGDALALHSMQLAAQALGIAGAWLINLFNPQKLILGGGLIRHLYHHLELGFLQELELRCLSLNREASSIALAHMSHGALGAAALVWHRAGQGGLT